MESGGQFNQEQKLEVLASATVIGMKEEAVVAGVHYTTIYDWRRQLAALGEESFLARKVASRGRGVKRITESQVKAILETWERHRGFGPGQVRNPLLRQGMTVSTRTVPRNMQAGGYQDKKKGISIKNRYPLPMPSIKREIFQSSALLALIVVAIFGFFLSTVLYYTEISKAQAVINRSNHAVVLFIEGYFQKSLTPSRCWMRTRKSGMRWY